MAESQLSAETVSQSDEPDGLLLGQSSHLELVDVASAFDSNRSLFNTVAMLTPIAPQMLILLDIHYTAPPLSEHLNYLRIYEEAQ